MNNYPDQIDLWMIKEVDLSDVTSANLTFWTWYSMETDWDYGYVGVSTDGGNTWTYLPGTLTTNTNPNGNNLGNGITGNSNNNWSLENMDLTLYTGNTILLGFRFKSDTAVNDEGWYIDDIQVTSGTILLFSDDAETSAEIKILSVNVTYPHLTLINRTDPITEVTTLQYDQHTRQVILQEDIGHPGLYSGYFFYDPFAEQYSGNYTIILDTSINNTPVMATTQFQTTIFGCQNCHNKKLSGSETSFIHSEGGGMQSCMYTCHSGSRGFLYPGSSPFFGPPLAANPLHVHEMQYGHSGGFLDGAWYVQPPYSISSHVTTTTCIQCHTPFIHDNDGTDTAQIASYTLYGINISFSSGTHKNLTCEFCHGDLNYPEIPPGQYQLDGTLGDYNPTFTSSESFTDTYIVDVAGTENLTLTVTGYASTKVVEVYIIGPVDNMTSGLQGPCGSNPCDIIQNLTSPINVNIIDPANGTWIIKLFHLQEGVIDYSLSSTYPIEKKPIIKIPECNVCHNSESTNDAYTEYQIPDWNPGFAHTDTNNDGTLDVQCRMCHNAMHDIIVRDCQSCHTVTPSNHPALDPEFTYYPASECLSCHGDPHNVTGGGGPDCIACHDIGKGAIHLVDVTVINSGIHGIVNNRTSNPNEACWGCHQTNGTEPSGMGDRYNTPYICIDCHLENSTDAGIYSAPIVAEHFKNGQDIRVVTEAANNISSCLACHQNISEMILSNNDAENGTFDTDGNGISGGPTNPYHYGKIRVDMRLTNETNCSYCHQNTSEFDQVFDDLSLTDITHDGDKNCYTCHREQGNTDGKIHDASLLGGGGGACVECHNYGGSGPVVDITDIGGHLNLNTSVGGDNNLTSEDCMTCHFNNAHSGTNVSNTYYCTDCHVGIINPYNSTIQFTDKQHGKASCVDCHVADGIYHQDNPRGSVANSTYVNRYNAGSSTVTNCADCHYASNLDDAPFNAPGAGEHVLTKADGTSGACANPSCHA
ncbi:MAG: immune inhibitor A, partial [ANME-2 cluster archaeon]|nr:immune inhibitor A [ANME-2 cluster archaeon]